MQMDKFTNKVLSFIRENDLISRGDNVVIGLSGGADSVSLLTVLYGLKRLLGIELCAVHVNHGLRGAEAERDELFCNTLCKKLHIYEAVHADVSAYAKEHGLTEEEAGRIIRYHAYEETGRHFIGKTGGVRLLTAVAHHADDQAETILFNMLRGSGLKGLGGMQPRRGNIIRPLLCVGKGEIVEWLDKKGMDYVTDSTNLENDHTRNRIRNIIMPELKVSVNTRAAEHIAAVGKRIYEAEEYIRSEAKAFIMQQQAEASAEGIGVNKGSVTTKKTVRLGQSKLKEKPQIFRIYVIIEALKLLGVPLKDWGDRHFQDIDKMLFMGNGAHTDLPKGASADNGYRETFISYAGQPDR